MCLFWLLAIPSVVIGLPGIILLNQTLQLIPTYTNLTDFKIGGKVLSNTTVTCWSLGIGMLLLVASAFSLYKAFRNWRYDKQLTTEP